MGLRPALAGARGPQRLRHRQPGPRVRLLPAGRGDRRQDVRAGRGRVRAVRARVGAQARAGGPARGREARAPRRPQGDPRRPLARRVDGGRVRGVGLQGPRRPSRPLRPRADGRRAARHVHLAEPRGRAQAAGGAAAGRPVPRPARDRRAVGVGRVLRHRRPVRARRARRARDVHRLPGDPGGAARAGPGHQRGRPRLRVRPHDVAGAAVADPRARGRARGERRPAAVGERRGDADRERRAAVRALAGRRRRVVLPEPPLARRRRREQPRPQRGHEAARPARLARAHDRPAAVRDPDRPHARARAARRAPAGGVVADADAARAAGRRLEGELAPRSADLGAGEEQVPQDRDPVAAKK